MKLIKDALLMGAGATMAVMYQKYSKPICHEMNKLIDKTVNKVNELEEMM